MHTLSTRFCHIVAILVCISLLNLSTPLQFVAAQQAAIGTEVCGVISTNTTWAVNHSPYIMTCGVVVNKDVTLVIQEGVVIKADGTILNVVGRLVSQGTTAHPVAFTSLKDDSYGGDTNNDGNATKPAPGDWVGVMIQSRSIHLNSIIFAYSSRVSLSTVGTGAVDITLENNKFLNNTRAIDLYLNNHAAGQVTSSGNVVSGNGINGMIIGGYIEGALRVNGQTKPNFPLVIADVFEIEKGGMLTLSPGTIVKGSSRGLHVKGRLVAQGTGAQPIVFTSLKDDSYGGDTNNDSTATKPAPGDWTGVVFAPGSTASVLKNCMATYGTYNISLINSDVSITGCALKNSAQAGIAVMGDSKLVLSGNSFSKNATYGLYNDSSNTIDARYTWWGDVSGPYHPTLNPTGKGDHVGNNVNFKPWTVSQ